MKKTILAIMLALALLVIPAGSALAADVSKDVTVKASPAILSIAVTPDTWDIDNTWPADATLVRRATTYYSNPKNGNSEKVAPSSTVAANECGFTLTNDGQVRVDTTILMGDMGSMLNGELGYTTSDVDKFGASFYVQGGTWPVGDPEILKKTVGGTAFISALDPGAIGFGIALKTQMNSFLAAAVLSSTVTIKATEVGP